MTEQTAEEFWDTFYAEDRGRWSGAVNAALAEEVADLAPGTALDLGCGQGGDAIWLAQRGWKVTAVDIAATALATAAHRAAAAGLAPAAIAFERHDIARSMPAGPFDLVTTTFLHSPVEMPRAAILRAAAGAVAPGGTLLVVGHAPSDEHRHTDVELPGPDTVLAELALPADGWAVRTSELRPRKHRFRGDDAAHQRVDAVVRVQRL